MPRLPALAAPFVAIAMSAVVTAASGAVYKCAGDGGVPLYTDLPCSGGAIVDIRPGTADPTAIARLEREQDRFAALALADARRAEIAAQTAYDRDRESNPASNLEPYEDRPGIESDNDVVYVPVFVGARPSLHRGHGHHHRSRQFARHHAGASGMSGPVPRRASAGHPHEPAPGSRITVMAWK